MGKRPAGARHIRTSAAGFPRVGAQTDAALDSLLNPGPTDPKAMLTPDDGVTEAEQAALDLDAILTMAFEIAPSAQKPEPEPVAVGPLSDDLLDDILGSWDLGTVVVETVAESLTDDSDAPPLSDAPAASATPRSSTPEVDDVFALEDDLPGETLPDLDLDDILAIDPTPIAAPIPPPRRKPAIEEARAAEPVPARQRRAAVPELDRVLQIGAARPSVWAKWLPRLVWAAILAGLVYVAFLPYAYEVGGDFVVQPLQRSEARSRTDGEIIAVNVREGDWVQEGQVIAVLSNTEKLTAVEVNEADDAVLRANLATLVSGAKPEEIAVAQQVVASAERLVAVTQRDLDRQQALFDSGTIPEKTLETARNTHEAAISSLNEATARLALVSSPTLATEIDAANAAITRNLAELAAARRELENTNIRAPQEGQIVSSLSEVPVGAYLPQGGLFAELENNRTVIAEVAMPETYIHEVDIGAPAELRLWSDPERSIFGTVRGIAPRAEERDFGWVIRVEVEVPNPDGRLAANMTGYGKVAAAERPVWQAFSEAIVGFFKIELWSWIP